ATTKRPATAAHPRPGRLPDGRYRGRPPPYRRAGRTGLSTARDPSRAAGSTALGEIVQGLGGGLARHKAELLLQTPVAEYRAVLQEPDLRRAGGPAAPLGQLQAQAYQPYRQGAHRLVQPRGNLAHAQGAGTGHVVDAGAALAQPHLHGGDHVLIPDEHEGRIAAARGEQPRRHEQLGDLVAGVGAEYGAGPEDQLLQLRMALAITCQHFLDLPLVVGVGELGIAAQRVLLVDPLRVVRMVAVGRAGAGHRQVPYPGAQAAFQYVAGAVDVDVEVPMAVGGGLEYRGQVHYVGDLLLLQQLGQRRVADIQLVYREVQIIPCPDIGPDDMQIRGQAVTQLMSEIAGGAGNQDARGHDSCSLMVAGARAGSSAGSGRRAQYWDRVRPLTRCHTPQKAVISSMPPALGKKVKRMTRPSPEFWMPTSRVTARRSLSARRHRRAMP